MENLFAKNTLVVNQKFTVLNNQYQVLDAEGKEIGFIQEKSSLGRTLLQFIVSNKMLSFIPFFCPGVNLFPLPP